MKTPVFYVPALHRQAAPAQTPPEAAFFPVLPLQASGEDAPTDLPGAAETLAAASLPLGRSEALAVLAEMLRQGEEFAADGQLRHMAANAAAPGADLSLRAEMTELEAFAAGKEPPGASAPLAPPVRDRQAGAARDALAEEKTRRALVDCQKILLLAHFQEERALEVTALQGRAQKAEEALLAALGEEAPQPDMPELSDAEAPRGNGPAPLPSPPWRAVVEAALAFLPRGAVLLTLDETMALDMKEAGMLRPLPEDRAHLAHAWPPELGARLLYAAVPGWRLAGRKGPVPERPWLDRECEVLAARPDKD